MVPSPLCIFAGSCFIALYFRWLLLRRQHVNVTEVSVKSHIIADSWTLDLSQSRGLCPTHCPFGSTDDVFRKAKTKTESV